MSEIICLSKNSFLKIKSTLYCREKSKFSKSLLVYSMKLLKSSSLIQVPKALECPEAHST